MEPEKLELSSSLLSVLERIGQQKVSASAFVQEIFNLHGEYAKGAAQRVHLDETSVSRTADEWLDEIHELFDVDEIEKLSKSTILHGRMAVIGLSLLEPALRRQLEGARIFNALKDELQEPLDKILSQHGLELYKSSEAKEGPPDLSDTVPNWPDDPLLDPEQDLLGRAAFARFLAKRIFTIPRESGAFSIHIYGAWGAGKSTLLNFLRKELEKKGNGKEWLVVEFNAWRHQQIQPPWWSLMERIFRETKKALSPGERFREYWWRFNSGRLQYFLGVAVLAWVFALIVFPLLRSGDEKGGLKAFAAGAESLSKILALVATVWGGIFAINRSLLLGSAQAAKNYTELTHDPTNEIRKRFTGLIDKLSPARVAILIDDLDRCQSRYVVDLLEGMQTLFREAPVVFVVAADSRWLNACYEEVYKELESRVQEPGKALGTLFLEKAFRFSTPMPGIPQELKDNYWSYLLKVKQAQWKGELAAARRKAHAAIDKAHSENEVRQIVVDSHEHSFPDRRALREEAAVKLASPDIIERIEHTLKPYAPLLEPNPRAMKLLVNGYSANRALTLLSEVEIDLHQLALWTILSARWPRLAEYLSEYPDKIQNVDKGIAGLPEALKGLSEERSVIHVLKGGDLGVPLSKETLICSARMRS